MPRKPGKPCTTPGCPNVVPAGAGGKCGECRPIAEQARGSRHERGYGAEHERSGDQALRGKTHCERCGEPFTSDNPPQRGHVVAQRRGGQASDGYAAHCRRCNLGWRRSGL